MSDSEWDWKASCDAVEELARRSLRSVMRVEGADPENPREVLKWMVSIQFDKSDGSVRVLVHVPLSENDVRGEMGEGTTLYGAFKALSKRVRDARDIRDALTLDRETSG